MKKLEGSLLRLPSGVVGFRMLKTTICFWQRRLFYRKEKAKMNVLYE
ncbi:MAG: hypothetical protein J5545_05360 [Bacteroidaceae bacterium]|nr:hypothetical protein [Bacteroidaceae bacterium]